MHINMECDCTLCATKNPKEGCGSHLVCNYLPLIGVNLLSCPFLRATLQEDGTMLEASRRECTLI